VRLDVIGRLGLAVAFRDSTGKVIYVGEDDLLPSTSLDQAVMYRLRHGPWPWIFALDNVLASRLLKCPDDGLWCGQSLGHWVHTVAMNGYDDEVVLLLGLLWNRQTEDLVHVFPRQRKFDVACSANCPYATILLVDQLERKFLSLGDRKTDTRICLEGFCRCACQAATRCAGGRCCCCCCAILRSIVLL
jgi:hypothetical protein